MISNAFKIEGKRVHLEESPFGPPGVNASSIRGRGDGGDTAGTADNVVDALVVTLEDVIEANVADKFFWAFSGILQSVSFWIFVLKEMSLKD